MFWLEQLGVTRNKVAAACGGPSCDHLDIVCEAIISISGMKAGHGQQVIRDMVRQITFAKLLIPPLLQWDIDIGFRDSYSPHVFLWLAYRQKIPCTRRPQKSDRPKNKKVSLSWHKNEKELLASGRITMCKILVLKYHFLETNGLSLM